MTTDTRARDRFPGYFAPLLGAYLALVALDVASTLWGFQVGLREVNPVLAPLPPHILVAAKAAGLIGVVMALVVMHRWVTWLPSATVFAVSVPQAVVVGRNFALVAALL